MRGAAAEAVNVQHGVRRPAKARIATVTVSCNSCGSSTGEVIATGRDHEYDNTTTEVFSMVRCRCGLIYLNPRPAADELATIYPPNYYAYTRLAKNEEAKGGGDSVLARIFRARNLQRFRPTVQLLHAWRPPPYRILDIGCGDGTPLNYWREALDKKAETYGVEMNEDAAMIARQHGHVVSAKRIEEAGAELPRGHFELVYSSNVIEHVEDPKSFLMTARDVLRSGGYAIIDTPNVDCIDRQLFGSHWGGFHFPRHWFLYNAKTFERLANEVGFEVLKVSYLPAAVFWVWSLHSLLNPKFPRLADAFFPPVEIMTRGTLWNFILLSVFTAFDYAAILGTGECGQMRVLLRRKD